MRVFTVILYDEKLETEISGSGDAAELEHGSTRCTVMRYCLEEKFLSGAENLKK